MSQMVGQIGSRVVRGSAWMVSLRLADRFIGFGSTLFMARLLFPDDFGLVALATSLAGALVTFTEFGFDLALIQNQKADRRHYDTAWTFGIIRSVATAVVLILIARPAAGWFDDSRLTELVYVFAFLSILGSVGNIGIVDFRKQLELHRHFILSFSSRLVGVLVAVALAFLLKNYWALVAGLLATSLMRVALSYVLHPYRPRFSVAAWRDLFHFSKWILLNGIVRFAGRRSSVFIIGALTNASSVGIYALASEIANIVTDAFAAPVKDVLFSGFSKLSHDLGELRNIFLGSYGVIFLVAGPAAVGIGLTAELIVPLMLGDRWLETVPVIEVLAVSTFVNALRQIRPFLLAVNKPNYVTYLTAFSTVLLLPSLILGVWTMGILGAALATAAVNFAELIVQWYLLNRFLAVSIVDIGRKIWRSLFACGLLAASVLVMAELLKLPADASIASQLVNLGTIVAIGVTTYITVVCLLWIISRRPADSAEKLVFSALEKALSTRSSSP